MSAWDRIKHPTTEDRYDIIGKGFAVRLRELEKGQRIMAEKIINDVLFEAEMGNLTTAKLHKYGKIWIPLKNWLGMTSNWINNTDYFNKITCLRFKHSFIIPLNIPWYKTSHVFGIIFSKSLAWKNGRMLNTYLLRRTAKLQSTSGSERILLN